MNLLKRLFVEEEGQGLVEYALIIAIVVLVAAATLSPLGTKIAAKFTAITTELGN